jgi:hypothetical protein
MSNASTDELVTLGEVAAELDAPVTRVRNVVNGSGLKEQRRAGTTRLFNRDEVMPLVRERLERLTKRESANG